MFKTESEISLPGRFPTITVNRKWSQFAEDFSVDVHGIADYLHGEGITDDEMERLTIAFTGHTPVSAAVENRLDALRGKERKTPAKRMGSFRNFSDGTSIIKVQLPEILDISDENYYDTEEELTYTLVHEMKHFVNAQRLKRRYGSIRGYLLARRKLGPIGAIMREIEDRHDEEMAYRAEERQRQRLISLGNLAINPVI